MGISTKSNEEANRQSAGYNGTRYISGTDAVTCKAIGFESFDDTTVIESVKDSAEVEQISNMNYDGVTLKDGKVIWFGFVSSSIKLASGAGHYISAE